MEPQPDLASTAEQPAQRTLKRSRTAQSVAQHTFSPQPDDEQHPASSASSSTLAPSQETRIVEESTTTQLDTIYTLQPKEEEPTIDNDTLSTAEQLRLIKGKGKATAAPAPPPPSSPTKPTAAETTRLEKELASKNSVRRTSLSSHALRKLTP